MSDSYTLGASSPLYPLARAHGIAVTVVPSDSGHTWQYAQSAFTGSLGWLAARVGVPGADPTAKVSG